MGLIPRATSWAFLSRPFRPQDAVVFTTQGGLYWLDIVDHFLTHYGLVVVGIGECLLIGWVLDTKALRSHVNRMSSIKLGRWWDILIKFFVPIVLSVIVVGDIYNEFVNPYEGYSWTSLVFIGFNWLVVTFVAALLFSAKKWKNSPENETT